MFPIQKVSIVAAVICSTMIVTGCSTQPYIYPSVILEVRAPGLAIPRSNHNAVASEEANCVYDLTFSFDGSIFNFKNKPKFCRSNGMETGIPFKDDMRVFAKWRPTPDGEFIERTVILHKQFAGKQVAGGTLNVNILKDRMQIWLNEPDTECCGSPYSGIYPRKKTPVLIYQ